MNVKPSSWPSDEELDRLVGRGLTRHQVEPGEDCLDPEMLASYVDGGLSAEARAEAEGHLATCNWCRRALALQIEADPERDAVMAAASVEPLELFEPSEASEAFAAPRPAVVTPIDVARPAPGTAAIAAPAATPSSPAMRLARHWLPAAAAIVAAAGLWFAFGPGASRQVPSAVAEPPQVQARHDASTTAAEADRARERAAGAAPTEAAPTEAEARANEAQPTSAGRVGADAARETLTRPSSPSSPTSSTAPFAARVGSARRDAEQAGKPAAPPADTFARQQPALPAEEKALADANQDARQKARAKETTTAGAAASAGGGAGQRAAGAQNAQATQNAPAAQNVAVNQPTFNVTGVNANQASGPTNTQQQYLPPNQQAATFKNAPPPAAAPAPAAPPPPAPAPAAAPETRRAAAAPPSADRAERSGIPGGVIGGVVGGLAETVIVGDPTEIRSIDNLHWWRIRDGATIEGSVNRGLNWTAEYSAPDMRLHRGIVTAAGGAWMIGERGLVLRYRPGWGWERVTAPTTRTLTSIAASDDRAARVTDDEGQVHQTTDGGRTWRAVPR